MGGDAHDGQGADLTAFHFEGEQASRFDARSGLPPAAARDVARAVAGHAPPDGVVLDVGSGTGVLGRPLLEEGARVVALEKSRSMLDLFARELPTRIRGLPAGARERPSRARVLLSLCDAAGPWPVANGAVDVILLSRVVHLLDVGHVVGESVRAGSRRAAVLAGGVERDWSCLRSRLRRRMLELLAARGVEGRRSARARRELLQQLARRGATPLPSVTAARWSVDLSPAEILDSWRRRPGLAGTDVPVGLKDEVLGILEREARDELGDLERRAPARERYVLRGARLSGRTAAPGRQSTKDSAP